MIALSRLLPIVFTLLLSATASAQHYYFTHYKVEQGLTNNAVFCSLQDRRGFVWLGTKDGLNRFDGHSFTVFRHDPADSGSIGGNHILSLYEDKGGVLWVGTNNGLYRYDAQAERFRPLPGTAGREIKDIAVDSSGNTWFLAGMDVHQYLPVRQVLRVFPAATFFPATALCATPGGTVWAASEEGLVGRWDERRRTFVPYDVFHHSPPPSSRWVEALHAVGEDTLFVGTSHQGVKLLDTRQAVYRDVLTDNEDGTAIFARDFIHAGGRTYWIATESGIFVYDLATGRYTHLKNRFGDPYSLSDNAVYTLCRDQEGGTWVGTFFGGAAYYPRDYNAFQKSYPTASPHSLRGHAVREICGDRYGHLWIGTEDAGLNRLDPRTGRFTHFRPGAGGCGLSYSNIHGLLALDDELWIGTFEHGLDVLHIPTGRVIRRYVAGSGAGALRSNFIHDLYRTAAGHLLVATGRGLYRYNRPGDNFSPLPPFPAQLFYTKVLEDSRGTIWAGTYRDGVYFFNPTTGQGGHYGYEAARKNSLPGNRVNDLYEDSQGVLWVATENGIARHEPSTGSFTRYTTAEGLPGNMVYGILEDERRNLWISTSKGLACFGPAGGKMTVYTRANGLLSDQFNYNSTYRDSAGRLYFGNTNGFISFQPAHFTPNPFTPPVYITGFQVANQEVAAGTGGSPLKKAISATQELTLAHSQSSFSIDFAALSYTAPAMTEYAYKMEGLDGDWTYLKTNRRVYFTELPAGTYTFRVKAAPFGGTWTGKEATLVIRVLPPFWATPLAKAVYFVLLLGLLYYGVRLYHRRLVEKKEKEIYQAKIDFFTAVAHEIRTPLTLIKGPVDNLQEVVDALPDAREDLATLERNTRRLMDLVTQILDFRQTEAGGFRLEFTRVNLSHLLRESYESFRGAARQRKLDYVMDLPAADVHIPADEEALTKVLSNLFSNAVKYAEREIRITLHPVLKGNTALTIELYNDGNIIPPALKEKIFEPFFRIREGGRQKGTGIGLSLARSLAELHGGRLWLDTARSGNTFVLHLPLSAAGRPEKINNDLSEVNH